MLTKTIIWDFDGTLVFHPGLWSGAMMSALDTVFKHHNISIDSIKPFLGTGFPWHEPEKAHPELSSLCSWWNHMENYLETVFEELEIDEKMARVLAKKTHEIYIDEKRYRIFPNTIETLDRLKKSGWMNVILSNHVPELPDIVRKLGFSNVIDKCFTSALIGYEKPNLMAFQYVLDDLNYPDICVMIGDNIKADIEGASAAGLIPILLHTPTQDKTINYCKSIIEVEKQLNEIDKKCAVGIPHKFLNRR